MSGEETPEELAGQSVISFATVQDCEAWFCEHDADHRGFWLKIGKTGAAQTVNYSEALDVALCHGWIDGQKRGYDESYWLQRFTPAGREQVVADQPGQGRGADQGRSHAPGRSGAGRRGEGRRPVGCGLCRPKERDCPRRLGCRAQPTRKPRRFSRPSRAPTALRSSTASTMRRSRRPGPRASRSSSRCATTTRPSTDS